jgi:hypothetical protein
MFLPFLGAPFPIVHRPARRAPCPAASARPTGARPDGGGRTGGRVQGYRRASLEDTVLCRLAHLGDCIR